MICTRKGCGKQFDTDVNGPEACTFHPGAPVFHEGLKGWDCCSKRVADFEDFLKISGCATGPHSDVKPEEKALGAKNKECEPLKTCSDEVESYQMKSVEDALPSFTAPKIITEEEKKKKKEEEEALELAKVDDTSVSVSVGSLCKRRGCFYKFVNDEISRNEGAESACYFHPGVPMFHEGSKGWTCCKRRVLEFDEFLKLKGCKNAKHIFAEKVSDKSLVKEAADCRFDWYQSQTHVILSIFVKNVDKPNSRFNFTRNQLSVTIPFMESKIFQRTFDLSQIIIPDDCKFDIMSSKVEISLKKGNGITWAALEKTDKISAWTTFGSGDSPLTPAN